MPSPADLRFAPGKVVCFQGEPMRSLYLLSAGSVEVIYNDPSDAPLDETKLERLGCRLATISEPGEMVGEMAALLRTRSASLVAGPSGAVLTAIPIPDGSLEKAILARTSLGVRIARTLARRLRDGNERWRALVRLLEDLSERTVGHARRFYDAMGRVLRVFAGRDSMTNLLNVSMLSRAYECGKVAARAPRAVPSLSDTQELALLGPPAGSGGSGDLSPAGGEGVRLIERDTVLFRRGEPGEEFHVVLEGRLQVEIDNREILVVERGGIVGEMAVLLEDPVRSATVRALESTRVLVVPRDRLQEIVDRMPWILVRLVHALADRLRKSNETIAGCRREVSEGLSFFSGLAREYGTLAENLASYRVQVVDLVEELRASQAEIVRAQEEFAAQLEGLFRHPPSR